MQSVPVFDTSWAPLSLLPPWIDIKRESIQEQISRTTKVNLPVCYERRSSDTADSGCEQILEKTYKRLTKFRHRSCPLQCCQKRMVAFIKLETYEKVCKSIRRTSIWEWASSLLLGAASSVKILVELLWSCTCDRRNPEVRWWFGWPYSLHPEFRPRLTETILKEVQFLLSQTCKG